MNADSGFLLGGSLRHDQPARGFRTGIEPVLLAASLPAKPGDRVLELGTGSGAGLLCLGYRVPRVFGVGVERDASQTRLARDNASANGLSDLVFVTADVAALPLGGRFDHAFANPPYHVADGTPSPDDARARAKRGTSETIPLWVGTMARVLRHRGTLNLVVPASLLATAVGAIVASGCALSCLFPLWPKAGRAAKLVILRAVKGGRMGCAFGPGLVLHGGDGAFTPSARAVLWDGRALPIDAGNQ